MRYLSREPAFSCGLFSSLSFLSLFSSLPNCSFFFSLLFPFCYSAPLPLFSFSTNESHPFVLHCHMRSPGKWFIFCFFALSKQMNGRGLSLLAWILLTLKYTLYCMVFLQLLTGKDSRFWMALQQLALCLMEGITELNVQCAITHNARAFSLCSLHLCEMSCLFGRSKWVSGSNWIWDV